MSSLRGLSPFTRPDPSESERIRPPSSGSLIWNQTFRVDAPHPLPPLMRFALYATPTDADDLAEQAATCRVFEVRVAR